MTRAIGERHGGQKGIASAVGEPPASAESTLLAQPTPVLDGRNAHVADGVPRALGREPRDFSDSARDAAATGVWGAGALVGAR